MALRSQSLQLAPSAGAVDILRATVRQLSRSPVILAIFVVVAASSLVSNSLGQFLTVLGQGVAVGIAYDELGGDVAASNSLGVRLLLLVVASVVAGFGILFGFALLVVPGVFLTVRLRLVTAAVMLEDSGPLEALGRSFDLTSSHPWTVFGVWAVPTAVAVGVGAAVVVASGGVTLAGELDRAALESSLRVAGVLATLVTGPVVPVADAIMYRLYGPDARDDRARESDDVGKMAG